MRTVAIERSSDIETYVITNEVLVQAFRDQKEQFLYNGYLAKVVSVIDNVVTLELLYRISNPPGVKTLSTNSCVIGKALSEIFLKNDMIGINNMLFYIRDLVISSTPGSPLETTIEVEYVWPNHYRRNQF